jgi:hypothetical protein
MGRHCAAMAWRKVSARLKSRSEEGRWRSGLMKVIRSLGWVDFWWFRRRVFNGMLYVLYSGIWLRFWWKDGRMIWMNTDVL